MLLVLLFCVSAEGGGVDRGSQSSVLLAESEIWSELRAIKNMVGEQEVELQTHRDNVASLEKENRGICDVWDGVAMIDNTPNDIILW